MQFRYKKITRVEFIKMHIEKLFGSHLSWLISKNISYKKCHNFSSLLTGNATSPNIHNLFLKV